MTSSSVPSHIMSLPDASPVWPDPQTEECDSTALATAILAGDVEQVRSLVRMGIGLTQSHHWVLYEACLQGAHMVDILLTSQRVNFSTFIPNATGDPLLFFILRTPSSRFSTESKVATVAQLLDNGIDPCPLDRVGQTVLHAVAGVRPESGPLLSLLLRISARVHINSQNTFLDTPLAVTILSGHFEAAQILLEHGADVHVKMEWGESVVQFALRRNNLSQRTRQHRSLGQCRPGLNSVR
ncbi:hypothetical protein M406DRAFT_74111 [Cryphonectria parasitica EP155]|uniref:Ankyrin n=1 Tax=Cryphonectria parasitica (strain ATCC 38755 / EP155) TaxID=660469 RepID=A0A9P4XZ13_CRYP1|nr:uncharacterized protein M406DRAFT_74111 [Cryphonectria parasitica EP155]KAF3763514.1 hypothetical protein M406DRAFT_74111 [Cryphonectria parasitica EP155]